MTSSHIFSFRASMLIDSLMLLRGYVNRAEKSALGLFLQKIAETVFFSFTDSEKNDKIKQNGYSESGPPVH